MYSKYAAHISSNGSHFLTAGFLGYYTYKVNKKGTSDRVTGFYVLCVYCTYRLKWKPIFDGWVLGVLNI